jgi:hypothetical protein
VKQLIEEALTEIYGPQVDTMHKLRSMVWWFRSSLNRKMPVHALPEPKRIATEKEKLAGLWKKLKPELDEYSTNYIRKRLY